MASLKMNVLAAIKQHGPVSVRTIMNIVVAGDEPVRSAIGSLRALKEPVWFDNKLRAFWWSDDKKPSDVPFLRWKRDYDGSPSAKKGTRCH